jgi:ABC-2 type transport system permease protein
VTDLRIVNSLKVFKEYTYLLQQLVIRDFKVKYKRSILGVLWSVLNPLFTMIILTLVFSHIFNAKDPSIKDYSVYLLSGLIFFNYFSEATTLAMGSIVNNFNLITKVYMPKYIFPFSKVLSSALNFLFSFVALYLILGFAVAHGTLTITWVHIFLPLDMIYVIIFALGVGLFLSAISVFFRDMFYIYGILLTAWMYLTPIMYSLNILKDSQYSVFMLPFEKINPLYYYINYARTIILSSTAPSLKQNLVCLACSIITLIIGTLFFRSKQDQFVYYI